MLRGKKNLFIARQCFFQRADAGSRPTITRRHLLREDDHIASPHHRLNALHFRVFRE